MRDGNHILAVLRFGEPGRCQQRVTVPSGPAQQALLAKALTSSKLTAADIDYVEAMELVLRWATRSNSIH